VERCMHGVGGGGLLLSPMVCALLPSLCAGHNHDRPLKAVFPLLTALSTAQRT
jgi:hypothetical protein